MECKSEGAGCRIKSCGKKEERIRKNCIGKVFFVERFFFDVRHVQGSIFLKLVFYVLSLQLGSLVLLKLVNDKVDDVVPSFLTRLP